MKSSKPTLASIKNKGAEQEEQLSECCTTTTVMQLDKAEMDSETDFEFVASLIVQLDQRVYTEVTISENDT
jgi:hypothetical protein